MKKITTLNAPEENVIHTLPRERKSSSSKYFLVLFLITTIILFGFYIIEETTTKCDRIKLKNALSTYLDTSIIDSNEVCLTQYCIKAAKNILESIDQTVNPCENFYQFTCGTWINNTEIPTGENEQDILNKMEVELNDAIIDLLSSLPVNKTMEPKAIANARLLYASCIDEETIEAQGVDALLSLIKREFGGWPILQGSNWDESTFNLSQLWFKLNEYNHFFFYHIETKIDRRNISTYGIQISPSHLDLEYRGFYSEGSRLVLALPNNASVIENDIDDIFNFEKEVAKCHRKSIDQSSKKTIRTTVKNLARIINMTLFDFTDHLRHLYLLGNVTLSNDDTVIVNDVGFIRNISSLITQQSPRTLQNYMIWRFVIHQVRHMPKRFRTIFIKFRSIALNVHNEQPRTRQCINLVNDNMGFAVSKLYIDKYFDKFARNEVIDIVDNIRSTFIEMVNQSVWMDAISKKQTIDKAEAILGKIGYPDYLESDNLTKLENIYAEYNFNSSHMHNVLLLLQLNARRSFQRFGKPVDRQEWIDYAPATTNTFYHSFLNKIVVPAGILRPPLFHKDVPKYLNYGAIGFIVGHEIAHGFDELRRHIDKDGNRYTSCSNETIDMFNKRSECIIEQYSNYTVAQVNLQVNGKRTREENIADNDGLKHAFYAYQKWIQTHGIVEQKLPGLVNYSAEQLFFISFGHLWCSKMTDKYAEDRILSDNHSPSPFRIIGPTSNFLEFDRAFNCTPGQGNSRVNKCNIW